MKKKIFEIEDLGIKELPEEIHLLAIQKIKEADEEIEQMRVLHPPTPFKGGICEGYRKL